MTLLSPHHLEWLSPAWFASIVIALAVGFAAGLFHFRSLKGVARRLANGDLTAIALQLGRLALLGAILFGMALFGAQALLAGAAGVLFARRRVLARSEAEAET
ncbi:MAG: hypothetical protein CL534_12545 [Ahrensia sp.]|nr:hypothetical protein [Ahrensia sp.]